MAVLKGWNQRTRRLGLALVAAAVSRRRIPSEELRRVDAHRILVVRQDDRIGNLLFITPLLAAVRERFPHARIDVVVSGRFPEVLAAHPAVDRQIVVDRRGLRRRPWRFLPALRALRRERYDIVLDCKVNPSLSNTMVVLLSRHEWSVGFDHEYSRRLYGCVVAPDSDPGIHESERLHGLFAAIWQASPCGPMEFHFPPGRNPAGPPSGVSLHVGGHGRKRIPVETHLGLIREIVGAGFALKVLGGPEESEILGRIAVEMPGVLLIRPRDVVDLAAHIAGSQAFIVPDTGALHIASALNVPTVNLTNGPVDPAFGPRSERHLVADCSRGETVDRVLAFLRALPEGVEGCDAASHPGSDADSA